MESGVGGTLMLQPNSSLNATQRFACVTDVPTASNTCAVQPSRADWHSSVLKKDLDWEDESLGHERLALFHTYTSTNVLQRTNASFILPRHVG
jgi:hypothetical protein